MGSVQRVIFPGMLFGAVLLVLLTGWIANPQMEVQAAALGDAPVSPVLNVLAGVLTAPQAEAEPVVESSVQAEEEGAVEPEPEVEEQAVEGGCQVSEGYPADILQWCEIITRKAAYYGVDPNLVAAVMLQESGGHPQAYSSSGAVGLMQVMPRDGLAASFMCKNGPCFSARPSMDELFDPEFNIDYGTGMISNLIGKHGDVREALRAYGPMDMGYRYADIVLTIYANY